MNFISLTEAAKQTGKSITTIRRWIETGKIPGVTRTAKGGYQIPVQALLGVVGALGSIKKANETGTNSPDNLEAELTRERLAVALRDVANLEKLLEQAEARSLQANETVSKLTEILSRTSGHELTTGTTWRERRQIARLAKKAAKGTA